MFPDTVRTRRRIYQSHYLEQVFSIPLLRLRFGLKFYSWLSVSYFLLMQKDFGRLAGSNKYSRFSYIAYFISSSHTFRFASTGLHCFIDYLYVRPEARLDINVLAIQT